MATFGLTTLLRRGMEVTRDWFQSVGSAHISPQVPADERRCLYATNIAIPFHLLSTAPYALLFAIFGEWRLAALVVPLCACYALSHVLMRKGRTIAARHLLLLSITSSIFLFCLFLGERSRLEIALFYTVSAPFLFFSAKSGKRVVLSAIPPCVAYAVLHLWGYDWMRPFPLTETQLEVFNMLITITTALMVLIPLFFLLRHILSAEAELVLALDEAESSNRAKSQFLGMVSHELRTPLNGLVGSLELVGTEPLSYQQRDNLEIARSTGSVLRTIIGDILEFSRLEEGGVVLDRRPARLQTELPRILHPYRLQAETKGLVVQVKVADDLPRLFADVDRLRQILLHLVGNAVKFTEKGSIEVSLQPGEPRGDGLFEILLQVRDTGIGMGREQCERLFDPFSQLHRDRHLNAGGAGLGLALTSHVVRAMNGTIEVHSRVGVGTSFLLRLLLERVTELRNFAAGGTDREFTPPRRILLVEDEPVNRLVASKLLRREGFEVVTAVDGAQGVELWKSQEFPVVLMDCQMPVLDGFGATRAIRALEENRTRARTLIIAYTANALTEDRRRCAECGMDGFLAKPVSRRELLAALSSIWPWSESDDDEATRKGDSAERS